MPLDLAPFADIPLTEALLEHLLERHDARAARLRKLWDYYRNPEVGSRAGRARLAQERGLPTRLTGRVDPLDDDRFGCEREIVVENDIAWRVHTLVDFLAGRPVSILSAAPDEAKRRDIQALLDEVFERSGGGALLQDAALLCSVYGHVDLLIRADALFSPARPGAPSLARAMARAADVRIEPLEPTRAIPLINPHDYRRLDAMILRFQRDAHEASRAPSVRRFLSRREGAPTRRATIEVLEVHSANAWRRFEDGELAGEGAHHLGEVPVVHVQNVAQPFAWEGLSDVEPLIPLQDELNTRLSDRANRVTMQAFRMYLAKGLDGFADAPIGPGQVFATDNPDASVEVIGADAPSPSEEAHIEGLREALDKASSVTPVAAGVLRAGVGQLSSENALRVTLLGALAKTARKQATFGRALAHASRLILRAFDEAGIYRTEEADRAVRIVWPEPVPATERERLDGARARAELGVPRERVLASIGESPLDVGVE